MNDKLESITHFFKYDLEIKKLMYNLAFDERIAYSQENLIKYSDDMFNGLETIEYYFIKIISMFGLNSNYYNRIYQMFSNYKQELVSCGCEREKLKKFYQKYISDISPELVYDINDQCVGYASSDCGLSLISKTKTVNELLHLFHSHIVNNDNYYQSIEAINEKINQEEFPIVLRGKQNPVAEKIFNNFPTDISCGQTDILSLPNKTLIMVRDRGHALTIEIDNDEDKCFVTYFIPKICNVLMVNQLKGVKKVDENSNFTVGEFECDINNISNEIIGFIKNVPMDEDMFIEGGTLYNLLKR